MVLGSQSLQMYVEKNEKVTCFHVNQRYFFTSFMEVLGSSSLYFL